MSPFQKPQKPKKETSSEELEKSIELFGKGAKNKSLDGRPWDKFSPEEQPNKSFTIPINQFDLEILRHLNKIEERSMRTIARRILSEGLKSKVPG